MLIKNNNGIITIIIFEKSMSFNKKCGFSKSSSNRNAINRAGL